MVWNVIFWGLLIQTFGMASELDKIVRTDHKNLFATVHSTILTTEKTVWLDVGKKQLLGQKGLLIQSNMQTCRQTEDFSLKSAVSGQYWTLP